MATTLTYRFSEEQFYEAAHEVHIFNQSEENMAFALFFDAIEQTQLIVGIDLNIVVSKGSVPVRTRNGDKAIAPLYIVNLHFADKAKAMMFKLSHQGGEA